MCWSRNVLCFAKLVPSVLVVSQVSDPTATGVSVVPGHESNCNKVCHEFGKWEVALQQGRCCFCAAFCANPWVCIWNCRCIQLDEGRRKLLCHNTFPILLLQSQKKNLKEHHTIVMRSYNTTMRIWGFSWLGGNKTVTLM